LAFTLYVVVVSGIGAGSASGAFAELATHAPAPGARLAQLRVPSVGLDEPVLEGTASKVLSRGLGHLRGSALPGAAGESVVVGHRVAYGARMKPLEHVRVGDEVELSEATGSIRYRVTSVATESRAAVRPAVSGSSRLTLVTGASAVNPARVLVVRTQLVGGDEIARTARSLPASGGARLPGADDGQAVIALACLAFVGFVLRARRSALAHSSARWISIAAVVIVLVVVYAAFVAATRALPPTF
jgi:sortase A